ncbi:MAG: hypothetical protein ACR2Q4_09165 [Geminicoccaceae bacterium]
MRWTVLLTALALTACGMQQDQSPYLALAKRGDPGPNADAVFKTVENHARCAGFHRASAKLAAETPSRADFYAAAAEDAEIAAVELATASISKELATDMVDQLAQTHAARWAYLIEADNQADPVQDQASRCFEMASEQQEILREVVKAKYGFSRAGSGRQR